MGSAHGVLAMMKNSCPIQLSKHRRNARSSHSERASSSSSSMSLDFTFLRQMSDPCHMFLAPVLEICIFDLLEFG
jgi:hypothetical protein